RPTFTGFGCARRGRARRPSALIAAPAAVKRRRDSALRRVLSSAMGALLAGVCGLRAEVAGQAAAKEATAWRRDPQWGPHQRTSGGEKAALFLAPANRFARSPLPLLSWDDSCRWRIPHACCGQTT